MYESDRPLALIADGPAKEHALPAAIEGVSEAVVADVAVSDECTISRRGLLQGIMLGLGSSAIGAGAAEWRDSRLSLALLEPDIEDIPSVLPAELTGKNIRFSNEHYRPDFVAVVTEALALYEATGGKPYYKKPPYYLGQFEMWMSIKRGYGKDGEPGIDADGKPYERLINFSGSDFKKGARKVYNDLDPGTSARQLATQRLIEAARQDPQPSEERDAAIITRTYAEMFTDAKAYIDEVRQGGRVSTSVLCAYFLGKNKGDIVTSLLDTTLFLKLAARAKVQGLIEHGWVGHRPEYENARLISSMFYDEFSSALPLEDLVTVVDKTSELNDAQNSSWKDYDPVNRAGTPYHVWNIIALSACAHPVVPQKIVLGYYASTSGIRLSAHGRIKVEADFHAARQCRSIRAVFDKYAVD